MKSIYNNNIENIRDIEFPFLTTHTYLDHTGSTLYSQSQLKAIYNSLSTQHYSNPHSGSLMSRETIEGVERVRTRVLDHFKTDSKSYSVIFTNGCTAAFKLVAECFNFHGNPDISQYHVKNTIHSSLSSIFKGSQHSSGCFTYLQDNHNSVVGMREIVKMRGVDFVCLRESDLLLENRLKKLTGGNILFAFPAQSNFHGRKYPLTWLNKRSLSACVLGADNYFTLVDASSFAATSPLDLNTHQPDFVIISFYKIFGYPTSVGALLVKREAKHLLQKVYIGGGTVDVLSATSDCHLFRGELDKRFEDGTLPFLEILSIIHGFNTIDRLACSMSEVSEHTFSIAKTFYESLIDFRHHNDAKVAEVYNSTDFSNMAEQGPIVSFNLKRSNGSYVGYSVFTQLAERHHIHVGHNCGDDNDLIDGRPTGCIRVSFGYMSTMKDAETCLRFIDYNFVSKTPLQHSLNDMRISEMNIYPIKSCSPFKVRKWPLWNRGLLYDRYWLITNEAGKKVTLEVCPRLHLIKPEIDLDNNYLCLHCEGYPSYIMPIETQPQFESVFGSYTVCGKRRKAVECGRRGCGVNKWLSRVLGEPDLGLVYTGPDDDNDIAFNNQGQFHMVSLDSAQCLRERLLDADTDMSVEEILRRARPNFVIDRAAAFAEDNWDHVRLGNVVLKQDFPTARCKRMNVGTDLNITEQPHRTIIQWPGREKNFGVYFKFMDKSSTNEMSHEEFIEVGTPVNVLGYTSST